MSFVTRTRARRAPAVQLPPGPWHELRSDQAMPSTIRFILALCLVFAAAPARPDPVGANERARPAEAAGDAWIRAGVAAALLMDDALSVEDMRVTTKDGRVRLSGVVPSNDDARAAERIAWRVEGVHAVVDALSVRGARSAPDR
jgi:hypothetical protein